MHTLPAGGACVLLLLWLLHSVGARTPLCISCVSESLERPKGVCVGGACGPVQPAGSGTAALHRALKATYEAVLPAAEGNSEVCFGKKMSRAILKGFQRPLINLPRE